MAFWFWGLLVMSDTMFNIAKGIWRYYCTLPDTSDRLLVVLFKSAGLQADDVLNNYTDLASLKASNAEADFSNYVRKPVTTGIVITPNNTTNSVDVDAPDQTWTAAAPTNALGAVVWCYAPASNSLDSAIIPLWKYGVTATTNGSDLIASVNAAGLAGSS